MVEFVFGMIAVLIAASLFALLLIVVVGIVADLMTDEDEYL